MVGRINYGINPVSKNALALILSLSIATSALVAKPTDDSRNPKPHEAAAKNTISGKIKGYDSTDHHFEGKAGESVTINFKSPSPSAYFNLLPPGSEEALFIGSVSGNTFKDILPKDGTYTIRPYLMGKAESDKETVSYKIEITGLASAEEKAAPSTKPKVAPLANAAFDKKLDALGISFHVLATTGTAANTLQIIPAGLKSDNAPIERKIEGFVTGAEWADINSDGSPEIYVYVTSPKPDGNVTLVAYSANNKKSLSEIYLPSLADDPKLSKGFNGHSDIAVVENVVAQRFPIYSGSGADARPIGKMRQVQYKLKRGEAGWVLKVDRVEEF